MLARRSLLAAFGMALLPAACSSPNPVLYTLALVPGAVHQNTPHVIELRAIALARYLERSQIVQSSENYRLNVLSNDWWGEPLDAMLSRVLVQELAQRLPDSSVFAESGAISVTPDATVELNLQRLDADASGMVVLTAQVAVTGRHTATGNVSVSVRPEAGGTAGLVAAMSTATGQLADQMATMLTVR
jgi:hypothetical protein